MGGSFLLGSKYGEPSLLTIAAKRKHRVGARFTTQSSPIPIASAIIDITTRKLRYFVAVAEELHFSRAAARLHLAQQALSRQIKSLESEVGTPLFERTTRSVALTPAGRSFLTGARTALEVLDSATLDAQRTARELSGTLRLGYVAGAALELTPYILDLFRDRHPAVTVEMHEFPATDPSAGLASGAADAALLRMPQSADGIDSERLFTDPVVAMLSHRHPCASWSAVSATDLLDDPITVSETTDDIYRAFWRLDAARRPGNPARVVPIGSVTEEVQVVAAGAAIAITSAAMTRYIAMPMLRCVPVRDWPASQVAVGWRRDGHSPLISRFVEAACDARDRQADLVRSLQTPPAVELAPGFDGLNPQEQRLNPR